MSFQLVPLSVLLMTVPPFGSGFCPPVVPLTATQANVAVRPLGQTAARGHLTTPDGQQESTIEKRLLEAGYLNVDSKFLNKVELVETGIKLIGLLVDYMKENKTRTTRSRDMGVDIVMEGAADAWGNVTQLFQAYPHRPYVDSNGTVQSFVSRELPFRPSRNKKHQLVGVKVSWSAMTDEVEKTGQVAAIGKLNAALIGCDKAVGVLFVDGSQADGFTSTENKNIDLWRYLRNWKLIVLVY
ncbi:unnamed protein product [Vitrella brassicaformis CCMP3155]|uniref:Uncharacterized protein n=1 Tax=Vitrella brassicaformis (strain CCMP3155) TaxID=1169540 RepID=A0A0G4H0V0_VITBC|nr:unnamed protein product [Vitrella brassicaformis CCMP3155]|eukprot:CEM37198.1 unnamed protein product [Vitrella brassicaformis CCMP3155]